MLQEFITNIKIYLILMEIQHKNQDKKEDDFNQIEEKINSTIITEIKIKINLNNHYHQLMEKKTILKEQFLKINFSLKHKQVILQKLVLE